MKHAPKLEFSTAVGHLLEPDSYIRQRTQTHNFHCRGERKFCHGRSESERASVRATSEEEKMKAIYVRLLQWQQKHETRRAREPLADTKPFLQQNFDTLRIYLRGTNGWLLYQHRVNTKVSLCLALPHITHPAQFNSCPRFHISCTHTIASSVVDYILNSIGKYFEEYKNRN